ncbi:hypothetical protein BJ546DRAFT_976279 [Cryomyces antarcticus]|uniref:Fe2OG dioxygenase domain-containing protein n=1 Tax=Cryomyces antarcticus TaxID=329879 RepID=A0ABR0LZN0_9PEZI|nr:hypothetical protein LTR16_000901 [Cryomyces antarcticus]
MAQMGNVKAPLPFPVIDISPFTNNGTAPHRERCAKEIASACSDHGFFYVVGHGIPASITDHVLGLARCFFLESTDDDKVAIARKNPGDGNGDGARGHQRIGDNVTGGRRDWHEAVDFYAEVPDTSGPPYELLKGPNLWPRHPPELRKTLEEYVELVKAVGQAIVKAMGVALELGDDEDIFVRNTFNSFWVMRMIGYPGLDRDDVDGFSCGEHSDYGCITLLLADSTKGALQVQTKNGDWVDANPLEGAFVVNIGDMMERWTNGLWKSTRHRVVHRGENFRVSVPFFFEPDWDARIVPLEKCVERTGGQRIGEEVVYGEHLVSKVKGNFY